MDLQSSFMVCIYFLAITTNLIALTNARQLKDISNGKETGINKVGPPPSDQNNAKMAANDLPQNPFPNPFPLIPNYPFPYPYPYPYPYFPFPTPISQIPGLPFPTPLSGGIPLPPALPLPGTTPIPSFLFPPNIPSAPAIP